MSENKAGDASGAVGTGQPRFTKRKQFLGFKIKSKPIADAGRLKPEPVAKKPMRIKPGTIMLWVGAILAAIVVGLLLRHFGYAAQLSVIAGIAVYLLIFGLSVAVSGIKRRSRRKMLVKSMLLHENEEVPQEKASKVTETTVKQYHGKGPRFLEGYINKVLRGIKGLEASMADAEIKGTPYEFVARMMMYSVVLAVVIAGITALAIWSLGFDYGTLFSNFSVEVIFIPIAGIAAYMAAFNNFVRYPLRKGRINGKLVERDILFAIRDIIISMRSGMPLFNAMTTVSTGYGEASRQFKKIIDRVELGMPIEQAMEEVSEKSQSKTFKKVMLQASVSIKAGVDVASTLQEVVNDVEEERIIELRRYGSKLNALAMFYMLFGVIFPSIGVAVLVIMSTFISIFPVTYVTLALVLVFIVFIQLMLLNIMKNSRPIFAM